MKLQRLCVLFCARLCGRAVALHFVRKVRDLVIVCSAMLAPTGLAAVSFGVHSYIVTLWTE